MTTRRLLEITPEPSPEERAAIEAAVAQVQVGSREPRSTWWHAGLVDALGDDQELQD